MLSKVVNAQQRRFLFRPRVAIYVTLSIVVLYCMLRGEGVRRQAWKQAVDFIENISPGEPKPPKFDEKPLPLDEQKLTEDFKQEWEELGR